MGKTLTSVDIDATIKAMGVDLAGLLAQREITQPLMIGVHTGGLWVAQKMHQALGLSKPLGEIDISLYRDDFTRIGLNPQVKPSQIHVSIEGEDIVLVDEVL